VLRIVAVPSAGTLEGLPRSMCIKLGAADEISFPHRHH
jgi:hypothetical protein